MLAYERLRSWGSALALAGCIGVAACSAGGGNASSGVSGGSGGSPPITVGGAGGGASGGSAGGAIITPPDAGTLPPDEGCDSVLEVTFRDFSEAHPDFEMGFSGDVVRRGLVEATLGTDLKPIFKSTTGCPPLAMSPTECDPTWSTTTPVITGAETFAEWYTTIEGTNYELPKQIELAETPPGSGQYVFESATFFPLSTSEGFGATPPNHHLNQNFLFTTEIHVSFGYVAGQRFTFRGDDDLWIFVNGKLALDLGSMHSAVEGTIDFDAQAAALGIYPGSTYSMDIFHAERHTSDSNFKFTTNISCFTPVVVK